ncbi:winged-helix domain-containing protein [Microbacterium sp. NPDC087591]|uniref:winged helix-turn-helix transcriptional regulator n=1 Tax=Microbacterium sp. NPDC087591 TaxID=3364192 RepID=UPI003809CF62
MAQVLVLTNAPVSEQVLPALELLSHRVRQIPAEPSQLVSAPEYDLVIVDGRHDLVGAKSLCRLLRVAGQDSPLLLVVTEGGMSALSGDWEIDDVILSTAGPAETDARVRLALARRDDVAEPTRVQASGVTIDEQSYSAKLRGKPLDLTYKEFQLLHFLATHPSRVFTREQLLSEVWGYDYFGGTRTVDVHVRRLRAKLGDQEQIIGTVRNVGYRFNVYDDESVVAAG